MNAISEEGSGPQAAGPGSSSSPDPRYQLVWEEARRAVEIQLGQLDEVRGRGIALISLASAAAFVASTGLTDGQKLHATTWVGILAFALNVAVGAFSLLPKSDWRFHRRASDLLADYVEADEPATLNDMHRDLALHLQADFEHNRERLKSLYLALRVGGVLLLAEILAFAVDLRGRR